MGVPVCAHRCEVLQQQIEARARGAGQQPVVLRLGIGLSREYVPPTPPRRAVRCPVCGHPYDGPGAAITARECADFDTATTHSAGGRP